jgi:hypothetical protein
MTIGWVPREMTTGRAVAQLGHDLSRLDMVLALPGVQEAMESVDEAAKNWESFRLSPESPATEVLLAAKEVVVATQGLAQCLAADLPQHLS